MFRYFSIFFLGAVVSSCVNDDPVSRPYILTQQDDAPAEGETADLPAPEKEVH
jgi:hypothetical protein